MSLVVCLDVLELVGTGTPGLWRELVFRTHSVWYTRSVYCWQEERWLKWQLGDENEISDSDRQGISSVLRIMGVLCSCHFCWWQKIHHQYDGSCMWLFLYPCCVKVSNRKSENSVDRCGWKGMTCFVERCGGNVATLTDTNVNIDHCLCFGRRSYVDLCEKCTVETTVLTVVKRVLRLPLWKEYCVDYCEKVLCWLLRKSAVLTTAKIMMS